MNEKKYWDLQDKIQKMELGFRPQLYLADPCVDRENAGKEPATEEFAEYENYLAAEEDYWERMILAACAAYQNRAEEYIARGEKIPVEIYDLI